MILLFTFASQWPMAVAGQSSSDDRFMGWYIEADMTQKMTADTEWKTSGNVAGECVSLLTGSCVLPTWCTSNILYVPVSDEDSSLYTCNPGYGCVAMTIFETSPFGAPSATNWDCRHAEAWSARTLYRTLPPGATKATTIYTAASPTITTGPLSSDTAPPYSLPTLSSSPTSSPLPTPSSTGSKAWIAGAVVGPVAGLALCATAYWLWMRRRKNRKGNSRTTKEAKVDGTQQAVPQSELSGGYSASPSMLRANSVRRMSELPG